MVVRGDVKQSKKWYERRIGWELDLPRHRCFPFERPVVEEAPFDLLLLLAMMRGFLLLSLVDAYPVDVRGPDSFMTILAWISSSLVAFTFFGQKRVTNLQKSVSLNQTKELIVTYVHRCRRHRSAFSPAACF